MHYWNPIQTISDIRIRMITNSWRWHNFYIKWIWMMHNNKSDETIKVLSAYLETDGTTGIDIKCFEYMVGITCGIWNNKQYTPGLSEIELAMSLTSIGKEVFIDLFKCVFIDWTIGTFLHNPTSKFSNLQQTFNLLEASVHHFDFLFSEFCYLQKFLQIYWVSFLVFFHSDSNWRSVNSRYLPNFKLMLLNTT